MKQLECEVAKLQQKLLKLPCYSYVPKPIDTPDEVDFKATKFNVDKAKLKAIKLVNKENQEYLASNKCCDLLDGLLSIMSKNVLNFTAKSKKLLHNAMIDWLKEAITKTNHARNAESLIFYAAGDGGFDSINTLP